ncbi:beta-lactamase-like protein [Talaromyces proteolyticus]|uniref:Beta-lactamase-like protein n=1 Tax=Talaromyces proteolyticus TaxID=1131652 RepID=A0AAD4PUL1_9EURO|nr:beta-lactamase-like protein [Talaromyces proteolyticus]KAH8692305.1 beta-lactamase-like protein [Talaromyces proteolyticus]
MPPLLQADVYISSRLPIAVQRDGESSSFSPISCTLIHGEYEAVLVDTPISTSQTEDLVSWIKETAPGKVLRYIYITHGHGDHWFGISVLRKHWPNLRAIATRGTVEHMKEQVKPEIFEGIWLTLFPGNQIPQPPELAETLEAPIFEIDGNALHVIEVGHTDTYNTTVLHVPSIRLIVAGDAVYGDVHQYFGEANTTEKRKEWLRALDTIEALEPHAIIAGHKRAGTVDGLFNLHKTREYILAFEEAVKTSSDWKELYQEMQRLYPGRINPHAILRGALAAFPDS